MDALDAAGCLGCLWMSKLHKLVAQDDHGCSCMLKMTLNAAGCLGCLSTHKFCLDVPRDVYGCSR